MLAGRLPWARGEADAEYSRALREAAAATIDHVLAVVELDEERIPATSPGLLSQARRAARMGVGLDVLLRRYFAGHAQISGFLIEEATREGKILGTELQHILRAQSAALNRASAALSAEYMREWENQYLSRERRLARRVERLLAGELSDTSQINYDFDGYHTAALARGLGATEVLGKLAKELDCRVLVISRAEETVWAWLGGRRRLDPAELLRRAAASIPKRICLAFGEPGRGLAAWSLSHRQAQAALPVALRGSEQVVRYADVAILAMVLADRLLEASLRECYLRPLEEGGEGRVLRETLRAYLAAERNVSSAAATLGIHRGTVASRLQMIEQRLGRPLAACSTEAEIALALQSLRE